MQRLLGTVQESFRFERRAPPAAIRAELQALQAENDAAGKRRGQLGWRAFYAFVFMVLGAPALFFAFMIGFGVLGGVLEEQFPGYEFVGILALAGMGLGVLSGFVALVLFIVLLVKRSGVKHLALDSEKLALAQWTLSVLGGDAKAGAPAHVLVDFNAYDRVVGARTRTGAMLHKHPWLVVALVLADGTRLRVMATVKGKKKERVKRKYTKKKEQWIDVIELRLADKREPPLPQNASQQIVTRLGYAFPRVSKHRSGARQVMLRFETAPCQRLTGRGAGLTGVEQRLDAAKLVSAIVRGYRAFIALRRELSVPPAPRATATGTQMMPQMPG